MKKQRLWEEREANERNGDLCQAAAEAEWRQLLTYYDSLFAQLLREKREANELREKREANERNGDFEESAAQTERRAQDAGGPQSPLAVPAPFAMCPRWALAQDDELGCGHAYGPQCFEEAAAETGWRAGHRCGGGRSGGCECGQCADCIKRAAVEMDKAKNRQLALRPAFCCLPAQQKRESSPRH